MSTDAIERMELPPMLLNSSDDDIWMFVFDRYISGCAMVTALCLFLAVLMDSRTNELRRWLMVAGLSWAIATGLREGIYHSVNPNAAVGFLIPSMIFDFVAKSAVVIYQMKRVESFQLVNDNLLKTIRTVTAALVSGVLTGIICKTYSWSHELYEPSIILEALDRCYHIGGVMMMVSNCIKAFFLLRQLRAWGFFVEMTTVHHYILLKLGALFALTMAAHFSNVILGMSLAFRSQMQYSLVVASALWLCKVDADVVYYTLASSKPMVIPAKSLAVQTMPVETETGLFSFDFRKKGPVGNASVQAMASVSVIDAVISENRTRNDSSFQQSTGQIL